MEDLTASFKDTLAVCYIRFSARVCERAFRAGRKTYLILIMLGVALGLALSIWLALAMSLLAGFLLFLNHYFLNNCLKITIPPDEGILQWADKLAQSSVGFSDDQRGDVKALNLAIRNGASEEIKCYYDKLVSLPNLDVSYCHYLKLVHLTFF